VDEKGVIISSARSKMESHRDINSQAEIISISLAKSLLKTNFLTNCALYTTFEPCQQILNLALEAQIHSLYYGASDFENGAFSRVSSQENPYPLIVVSGILENDSKSLLESYFRAHQRESPNQILVSSRGRISK
jgi:tRNA(adenine34) deaminase